MVVLNMKGTCPPSIPCCASPPPLNGTIVISSLGDGAIPINGTLHRNTISFGTVGSQAITYTGVSVEKYHIPPTQHYMDVVIQGAYGYGLSMMWIPYLQSFSTQAGRKPRPPGTGDAAPRL